MKDKIEFKGLVISVCGIIVEKISFDELLKTGKINNLIFSEPKQGKEPVKDKAV